MSTVLEIKGIRKWRVAYDDSNWIIQRRKPSNKPPNDWVNKYYFEKLENLFPTLLELGVREEKFSDFKRIVNAYNKKSKLILDAIQKLGETFDLKPLESQRIKGIKKKASKKKSKPNYVQVLNPRTKRYVKVNKTTGEIVSHKKTLGAYKNIPIEEYLEGIERME